MNIITAGHAFLDGVEELMQAKYLKLCLQDFVVKMTRFVNSREQLPEAIWTEALVDSVPHPNAEASQKTEPKILLTTGFKKFSADKMFYITVSFEMT